MNLLQAFRAQLLENQWVLNNMDRRFLIWGLIWFAWFSVLVAMTLQGWTTWATAVAVASFFWLWSRFCDMMQQA